MHERLSTFNELNFAFRRERDLCVEGWRRRRSAKRGLRRDDRLRRADDGDEESSVALDGGSNVMRGVRGWPDDARPVTEDTVQRAVGVGGGAADAVRRGIVRHDDRADRIVTVVLVRQRRPDGERDEREQRGGANRP